MITIVRESSRLAWAPTVPAHGWSGCSEARRKRQSVRPASSPCSRCPAFCISVCVRAPRCPAAGWDCWPEHRSQAGPIRFFLWNLTVEKNDPRRPSLPNGEKRKKRKSQPCHLKSLYQIVPRGSLVPKFRVPLGAGSPALPSLARCRCLLPWGQELPLLPVARTLLYQHPGPRRCPYATVAHLHKFPYLCLVTRCEQCPTHALAAPRTKPAGFGVVGEPPHSAPMEALDFPGSRPPPSPVLLGQK